MTDEAQKAFEEVFETEQQLSSKVLGVLAGRSSIIVSSVLAHCLAAHIAGHVLRGSHGVDVKETERYRAELLIIFLKAVRRMIPVLAGMKEKREREALDA